MSDKDFAHIETTDFEREYSRTSNFKSLALTLTAVCLAILCFSVGFYIGENYGLETSKGNKNKTLVAKLESQQQELNTLKKEAEKWQQQEADTSQVGELTFYNELPEQSIVPEPLNPETDAMSNSAFLESLVAKNKLPTAPSINNANDDIKTTEKKLEDIIKAQLKTSSRTFRIQIASFKQKQDAERLAPKLLEIGLSSQVERVELGTLGVYYRVYTQSFSQEQKAIQAKQLIKEKMNITGIMVQNG